MSGYVARVRHDESPGGDVGLDPLVSSAAQRWVTGRQSPERLAAALEERSRL